MKAHRLVVISIGFCCALSSLPVHAQNGAATIDRMIKILTSSPHRSLTPAVEKEVGEYIDYSYIARYALGAQAWERLDESKKHQYLSLVRRSIEQKYYPRWHRLFGKGSLKDLGETRANGDTFVRTALTVGKKQSLIVWKLHGSENQLKVISLKVGDDDLLERLKGRFRKILEKGGSDKLIKKLAHRVDDDEQLE